MSIRNLISALGRKLIAASGIADARRLLQVPYRVTFYAHNQSNIVLTNSPVVARFIQNSSGHIQRVDLSGFSQARLQARITVAGAATGKLKAMYTTSASNTNFANYSDLGDGVAVSLSLASTVLADSGWIDIDPAATAAGEVTVALAELDGNAAADPAVRTLILELR